MVTRENGPDSHQARFHWSAVRGPLVSKLVEREQAPVPNLVADLKRLQCLPIYPKPAAVAIRQPASEIDKVNVLVVGPADIRQLDSDRARQLAWVTFPCRGVQRRADQVDLDAGLLTHLSPGRVIRELVRLDMPTRWEPAPKPGVPVKQDATGTHNEDSDGKVASGIHVRSVRNRALIR